jgi:predicted acyl esterase
MSQRERPEIEIVRDVPIPMRDGVRLAGNLYRPTGRSRCPCIVNYIPYHKDGRGGLGYADRVHRHFVRRGYAVMVIDFRGLGCSEGVNNTPFDAQEGRDGHDAVEWIAAQPWCDGGVGMWGVSYGGITALKAAAERPPHLKAIIPVHAAADTFTGFLLRDGPRGGFWSDGDWGPRMIGYQLTPPLGDDPDDRKARLWAERLEHLVPWPLEWYEHAADTARWAERAVPVEQITAPTYAVCGWHDFYVEGTVDYFNRIPAPKKLLLGPWKHVFPDLSPVEPVSFLAHMDRWWDRWLREEKNGIDEEPPVTVFVQGAGVWRHEEAWPPRRNRQQELCLLPGHELANRPATALGEEYAYDPIVGLDSIGSDPWTTAVCDPGNHNGDDGRSLCFTTAPLGEDWELTGAAAVTLEIGGAQSGFDPVARLCDVQPDGRSRLVTFGWRRAAAPAEAARGVTVPLRPTAYVFRRGHCIRLSIALADFPRLWPTPNPGRIRLLGGGLSLPQTPPPQPALPAPQFPPPGESLKSPAELEVSQGWRVSRELVRQAASLECHTLARLQDGDTLISYGHEYTASVSEPTPSDATIRSRSNIVVERPSGAVRVRTENVFTPETLHILAEVERRGEVIYRREWRGARR